MILRFLWIGAAVALVAVAIANTVNLAHSTLPAPIEVLGVLPSDPVMRAEARFAPVRAALHQRGITGHIGYFSDVPASQLSASSRGIEHYFSAQFALAPLILDIDGADTWIMTDFASNAGPTRLPAGYDRVADYGNGVRLLHFHS